MRANILTPTSMIRSSKGHIKSLQQDKAIALKQVMQEYFADLKPKQIITIGDSPNDESLHYLPRRNFPYL